jgi:hypothetical protein
MKNRRATEIEWPEPMANVFFLRKFVRFIETL